MKINLRKKHELFENLVMKISSFIDNCEISVHSYYEEGNSNSEFQKFETNKGIITTKRSYNDSGKEVAYTITLDDEIIELPGRIVSTNVEKVFTDISQDLRSIFYESHHEPDYSDYNIYEYIDE